MELNQEQVRTVDALATAFCHGMYRDVDITKVYDAPAHEGWLRVHIIPHYFLVDHEGTVRFVEERSTAPGYDNVRR